MRAEGYWARIWERKNSILLGSATMKKCIWPPIRAISKEAMVGFLPKRRSKKETDPAWVKFESREDMDSTVNSLSWGRRISRMERLLLWTSDIQFII